jgi:putative transposase
MSNTYTQLYVHLVWATWDRLPLLHGRVKDAAYACIRAECKKLGVKVIALGGIADHVHLFVELPTTVCIADLAKQVKGSSSHLINEEIRPDDVFKWQGGYAAFSVSKSLGPTVRAYIRNQEEHHEAGTTDKDAEFAWTEEEAPVEASLQ